jgi:hypothetical protein
MKDLEEQRAVESYQRAQQLKEAIRNAPRSVRRALAQPVVKSKSIIVTK